MAGTVKRDNTKAICLHEFDTVVIFIYNIYFQFIAIEEEKSMYDVFSDRQIEKMKSIKICILNLLMLFFCSCVSSCASGFCGVWRQQFCS